MKKILILLIVFAGSYYVSAETDEDRKKKIQGIRNEARKNCEKRISIESVASKYKLPWPLAKTTISREEFLTRREEFVDKKVNKEMPGFDKELAEKKFPLWEIGDEVKCTDSFGRTFNGKITDMTGSYIRIGLSKIFYIDFSEHMKVSVSKSLNTKAKESFIKTGEIQYNSEKEELRKDIREKASIKGYKKYKFIQVLKKYQNHGNAVEWMTDKEALKFLEEKRLGLIKAELPAEEKKLFAAIDYVFYGNEWLSNETAQRIEELRKVEEDKRQQILKAMRMAESSQSYSAGIDTLNKAISTFPDAVNIKKAETLLAKLKREMKQAIQAEKDRKQRARDRERRRAEAEIAERERKRILQKKYAESDAIKKQVVNSLLTEWSKGRGGAAYCTGTCDSLFAPSEWTIVDEGFNTVTVRVSSSTKGGFPIKKLWNFFLNEDGKVFLMTEN